MNTRFAAARRAIAGALARSWLGKGCRHLRMRQFPVAQAKNARPGSLVSGDLWPAITD